MFEASANKRKAKEEHRVMADYWAWLHAPVRCGYGCGYRGEMSLSVVLAGTGGGVRQQQLVAQLGL